MSAAYIHRIPTQNSRVDYPNALRPVTVRQALKAERSTSDNRVFYINGASCSAVQLVAQMVSSDVVAQKFSLEDSTRGRISCVKFPRKNEDGSDLLPNQVTELMGSRYVRVTAVINQYNGNNFLSYKGVEEVQDPYEIFFHLANVMSITVTLEKGPPSRETLTQIRTSSGCSGNMFDDAPDMPEEEPCDEEFQGRETSPTSAIYVHQVPSSYVSVQSIPTITLHRSSASVSAPIQPATPPRVRIQTPPPTPPLAPRAQYKNDTAVPGVEVEDVEEEADTTYNSTAQSTQIVKRVRWTYTITSAPQTPPTPTPPSQNIHSDSPPIPPRRPDTEPEPLPSPTDTHAYDSVPMSFDMMQSMLRTQNQPIMETQQPSPPHSPVEPPSPESPAEPPPSSPSTEADYESLPPSPILSMPGDFPTTPPSPSVSAPVRSRANDPRAQLGFGDPSESISAALPRNRARRLSRDPYDNLTALQRDIITTMLDARDEAGISSRVYPSIFRRFQREWEGVPVGRLVEVFLRHLSPSVPPRLRAQQFQQSLEDLLAKNYIKTGKDDTHFVVVD